MSGNVNANTTIMMILFFMYLILPERDPARITQPGKGLLSPNA